MKIDNKIMCTIVENSSFIKQMLERICFYRDNLEYIASCHKYGNELSSQIKGDAKFILENSSSAILDIKRTIEMFEDLKQHAEMIMH